MRVGKRETGRGSVQGCSYVVERPIEPGDAAFQERTIEMTETREGPVVDKTARVTEEVVVGKDVEERTETVGNTGRRHRAQDRGRG